MGDGDEAVPVVPVAVDVDGEPGEVLAIHHGGFEVVASPFVVLALDPPGEVAHPGDVDAGGVLDLLESLLEALLLALGQRRGSVGERGVAYVDGHDSPR